MKKLYLLMFFALFSLNAYSSSSVQKSWSLSASFQSAKNWIASKVITPNNTKRLYTLACKKYYYRQKLTADQEIELRQLASKLGKNGLTIISSALSAYIGKRIYSLQSLSKQDYKSDDLQIKIEAINTRNFEYIYFNFFKSLFKGKVYYKYEMREWFKAAIHSKKNDFVDYFFTRLDNSKSKMHFFETAIITKNNHALKLLASKIDKKKYRHWQTALNTAIKTKNRDAINYLKDLLKETGNNNHITFICYRAGEEDSIMNYYKILGEELKEINDYDWFLRVKESDAFYQKKVLQVMNKHYKNFRYKTDDLVAKLKFFKDFSMGGQELKEVPNYQIRNPFSAFKEVEKLSNNIYSLTQPENINSLIQNDSLPQYIRLNYDKKKLEELYDKLCELKKNIKIDQSKLLLWIGYCDKSDKNGSLLKTLPKELLQLICSYAF